MHFENKINLEKTTVTIKIFDQPYFASNKTIIFGNPFNFEKERLELNNKDFGNKTKGHWLKIDFDDTGLNITNDILGGYRIYYSIKDNNVVISDNYSYILNVLNIKPTKSVEEYKYWLKHGYTTNQFTLVNGLYKISPASILRIDNKGVKENTYFKNIDRTPDSKQHKELIHKDLLDTFSIIKKSSKKVILFFSGGKDSCLLLQYLVDAKIAFTPVFVKCTPINKLSALDIKKVRGIAKRLNLSIEEIELNLAKVSENYKQKIVEKQLFDNHFSLLHYLGCEAVKEKFGEDSLIINGQSSDCILSYGPSEETLTSFFRRNMLYSSSSLMSLIGLFLISLKVRKRFRFPKNELEKLVALFSGIKNTRVLEVNMDKSFFNYINDIVRNKTKSLNSYYSKEMYTKLLAYAQGSDNQVVINSASASNLEVIMPFATPNIIYSTTAYKDEELEIRNPKYVVNNILQDEFSFFFDKYKSVKSNDNDIIIDNEKKYPIEMHNLFVKTAAEKFE